MSLLDSTLFFSYTGSLPDFERICERMCELVIVSASARARARA